MVMGLLHEQDGGYSGIHKLRNCLFCPETISEMERQMDSIRTSVRKQRSKIAYFASRNFEGQIPLNTNPHHSEIIGGKMLNTFS